jgi:hypothetical protein
MALKNAPADEKSAIQKSIVAVSDEIQRLELEIQGLKMRG